MPEVKVYKYGFVKLKVTALISSNISEILFEIVIQTIIFRYNKSIYFFLKRQILYGKANNTKNLIIRYQIMVNTDRLHELTHFGLRITVGVLFIVHSIGKFDVSSREFFSSVGLPADMSILIGLLELIGGIFLVAGVLTRISSSLLAIEMLSVIIYVKKLQSFSGKGGVEMDLLAFAILLTMIVLGPGKISISYIIKKIPRVLQ